MGGKKFLDVHDVFWSISIPKLNICPDGLIRNLVAKMYVNYRDSVHAGPLSISFDAVTSALLHRFSIRR